MSTFPRRSARLSPHLQHDQRGGAQSAPVFANNFSQSSSTSTSSHPSPISDALHPPPPPPTPQQAQPRFQIEAHLMASQQQQQQQQQQQSHHHVPLPSPSGGDMGPFFGRPNSQSTPYTSQQLNLGYPAQQRQQSHFTEQQPQMSQQHQLHPHTNSMSQEHPAYTHAMNPGQLPPNFLAEAAKRAEMACLMRDLGDVSL